MNHAEGFRTTMAGLRKGWHTNDGESEFARFKHFEHARWGRLNTKGWGPEHDGELWEWVVRTNFPNFSFEQWLEMAAAGARAA